MGTVQPLRPPESVRDICRTLARAGFEAWCVGGAVRDALLGIRTMDWDIATSAHPDAVQKLFKRTVPVGIAFGTVGVLDRDGVLHEVTTFRTDVETDGRHAVVKFGASLDEDLARRDFTINAIAVHPETFEVRDPFHGQRDVAARVVRCVGDAEQRMQEDRLRALRALRFAGRFDFAIEPATWRAIRSSAPHLSRLSMERVKQELEKVMEQVARPAATLERYREAGVFAALIPSLATAPARRFGALDFLARPGPARRPQRRLLRLAALFVEPGLVPDKVVEKELKALKFSNVESRAALTLGDGAGGVTLAQLGALQGAVLRRLIARVGRLMVPGLARILWARVRAEATAPAAGSGGAASPPMALSPRGGIALYRAALRSAFNDPLTLADLAVDGDDLRTAGIPDGRAMGETLQRLLDAVLDDPARNTRDALLALATRK